MDKYLIVRDGLRYQEETGIPWPRNFQFYSLKNIEKISLYLECHTLIIKFFGDYSIDFQLDNPPIDGEEFAKFLSDDKKTFTFYVYFK